MKRKTLKCTYSRKNSGFARVLLTIEKLQKLFDYTRVTFHGDTIFSQT